MSDAKKFLEGEESTEEFLNSEEGNKDTKTEDTITGGIVGFLDNLESQSDNFMLLGSTTVFDSNKATLSYAFEAPADVS